MQISGLVTPCGDLRKAYSQGMNRHREVSVESNCNTKTNIINDSLNEHSSKVGSSNSELKCSKNGEVKGVPVDNKQDRVGR